MGERDGHGAQTRSETRLLFQQGKCGKKKKKKKERKKTGRQRNENTNTLNLKLTNKSNKKTKKKITIISILVETNNRNQHSSKIKQNKTNNPTKTSKVANTKHAKPTTHKERQQHKNTANSTTTKNSPQHKQNQQNKLDTRVRISLFGRGVSDILTTWARQAWTHRLAWYLYEHVCLRTTAAHIIAGRVGRKDAFEVTLKSGEILSSSCQELRNFLESAAPQPWHDSTHKQRKKQASKQKTIRVSHSPCPTIAARPPGCG